jgi:hypothetical protein
MKKVTSPRKRQRKLDARFKMKVFFIQNEFEFDVKSALGKRKFLSSKFLSFVKSFSITIENTFLSRS